MRRSRRGLGAKAVEADGTVRDGAWAAEVTGKLLDGRPKGMRLIVRKERARFAPSRRKR